jgi:hypothetical protein
VKASTLRQIKARRSVSLLIGHLMTNHRVEALNWIPAQADCIDYGYCVGAHWVRGVLAGDRQFRAREPGLEIVDLRWLLEILGDEDWYEARRKSDAEACAEIASSVCDQAYGSKVENPRRRVFGKTVHRPQDCAAHVTSIFEQWADAVLLTLSGCREQ